MCALHVTSTYHFTRQPNQDAAVKIQAGMRGMLARKKVAKMRKDIVSHIFVIANITIFTVTLNFTND